MREWHLTQGDPLTLRLAADVRLCATDYANDHIWEINLAGGDPPALAVRTTYGLRARDMRLYPGFAEGGAPVFDPAVFVNSPEVRAFYVNYARVTCEPLPGITVTADYWVPDSHTLAGQFTFLNPGPEVRRVTLHFAGVLKPIHNPRPLTATQLEILSGAGLFEGQTGNLDVVVMLEGPAAVVAAPPKPAPAPEPPAGAEPASEAPRPPGIEAVSVARPIELRPGEPVVVRWVQAASPTPTTPPPAPVRGGEAPPIDHRQAGLARIRELLAREWDGELARIELLNSGLLDIETGERDWDAALALAQVVALRCFVGPTPHLPHPSFIFTRHAERGYSPKGDGSDHNWQWNGQVATEAYVTLPQIVAAAPELAWGVLRNWLAVQADDGSIDWKPGLAGQRERALCLPMLATLAWRLYEHTEDETFLAEAYAGLRRFLDVWFTPRHDRDEDGVPEWSHTVQSAFDDNPSFVRWKEWGQGADITAAEAPDLASYLYRECRALERIAARLGLPPDPIVAQRAEVLAGSVAGMWRESTRSYHYVDRDTHASTVGEVLAAGRGDLSVEVHRRFAPAVRIVVKAIGPEAARPEMEVILVGRGRRGRHRVETLRRTHVQSFFGISTAVSEKLYALLERVEVRGLTDEHQVAVAVVDYTRQDQTLLLPLWAGLPDAERAEALVRDTLLDVERYWRPYGIPNCSAQDPAYAPDNRSGSGGVWMMWNTMLGEWLAAYGYRAEAAELVRRLMTVMLHCLREEKAFREAYNADQLEGLGDRDYIWGVAPVALFMQVIGVRIVSPHKVYLEGHNPFPWPVTVRRKGLTVTRPPFRPGEPAPVTLVTFPSGRSASVTGEDPHLVEDSITGA